MMVSSGNWCTGWTTPSLAGRDADKNNVRMSSHEAVRRLTVWATAPFLHQRWEIPNTLADPTFDQAVITPP